MKNNFKNWIAASLIVFGAVQVNAASITGTVQLTRDSSRSVNGAYLVTEKKDASGKPIALVIVLDENGKAIAQQYENKQIKIDGNVNGRNLTAIEWKEIRDNSYSGSSYSEPSSSRSSSYDDDEEEKENDEEEVDEDEEEDSDKKKSSKSSKKSKKKSDDDDEDSDDSDDSDNNDDSEKEDSEEKDESEDNEEKEDSDDSDSEEEKSDDDE